MKSVFDGYLKIESQGRESYFAGANTGEGFKTSYSDIVSEEKLERVYIIKGGSGTGKSTMMHKIADAAEKMGCRCEYYLCGSDPFSLDCVVLDKRIAILDGTAPHIMDMKYPGAASEFIDLSLFWNKGILEERRDEIIAHAAEKSAAYASAYRYLAAAEHIERERCYLAETIFDSQKAEKYALRLVKKLAMKKSSDSDTVIHNRYSHGLTMRGMYHVVNKNEGGDNTFFVRDYMGCAPLLMSALLETFSKYCREVVVSHIPILSHISEIKIPDMGITVSVGAGILSDNIINVSRFVKKEKQSKVSGSIRLAAAVEESCVAEAVRNFAFAAEHHFALEGIYVPSMDFDRMELNTKSVTDDILTRIM